MIKNPNEAPSELPTNNVEEHPVSDARQPNSYTESQQSGSDLLANILAVIGIIIVAVIVVWGLIHLIFIVRDWASSSFFSGRSSSTIATTSTLTRISSATSTATTTKPKNHRKYVATYAGPAHLAVSIMRVGVIDPSTGAIVARSPLSPADVVAVQFDISNRGGNASDTWYFDAQLPVQNGYSNSYTYHSPAQAPLRPGAHIINTLRFSPVARGGGMFTVTIVTGSNQTASQYIPSGY